MSRSSVYSVVVVCLVMVAAALVSGNAEPSPLSSAQATARALQFFQAVGWQPEGEPKAVFPPPPPQSAHQRLGGDDFDGILADLAITKAGLPAELRSNFEVLEECREKKESLTPNTKKIQLDFGRVLGEDLEVTIKVAEFCFIERRAPSR